MSDPTVPNPFGEAFLRKMFGDETSEYSVVKHREENKERCENCDSEADPNNRCVGCRVALCDECLDKGCPCTTPAEPTKSVQFCSATEIV